MHEYLVLLGRLFVFYKPASFHFTLSSLRSMLYPGTSGHSACLLYIKISKVARHYGISSQMNVKSHSETLISGTGLESSATLQNCFVSHSS